MLSGDALVEFPLKTSNMKSRELILQAYLFKRLGAASVDPEVLQSGFWFEYSILAWRSLGKWLAYFSANFSANLSSELVSLVSQGSQAPPPKKMIPTQNSRPIIVGIPLQFQIFEPKLLCLGGDQLMSMILSRIPLARCQ